MRALVVGGGGREHALAWSLARSASVDRVYAAPGNAGIASVAECVGIDATDADGIGQFAESESIDLVVVGPEGPLVAGVSDVLSARGLRVFGPSAAASRIEGSKAWAKRIMSSAHVPTANFKSFASAEPALAFLKEFGAPCVVKADGLAAGKGVFVCATMDEAMDAVRACLERRAFGDAGATIVIEEALTGEELSVFCLSDGTSVLPIGAAQDHKRLLDGDEGPNTGGMGAYSPVPHLDHLVDRVVAEAFEPVVAEMKRQGSEFRGVLFGGFIDTADGPKTLEFNCRFGDPETQVILPRLRSDAGELLRACAEGRLDRVKPEWLDRAAVCVVIAGGEYPAASDSGTPIQGLDAAGGGEVFVFHAGTRRDGNSTVTSGGRILGVTALGDDIAGARKRAYEAVGGIEFAGMQYRTDIAGKGVNASEGE